MKNKNRILIALSLMLLIPAVTGCGTMSAGTTTLNGMSNRTISAKLIKGETTKNEVYNWLGKPATVTYLSNGEEKVVYQYAYEKVSPTIVLGFNLHNEHARTLTLIFRNNVLQNYSYNIE